MPVESKKEVDKLTAATSKLDPALIGLAAKVVDGKYKDDKVSVENGLVQVYVHLTSMSAEAINTVKKAGGTVVSERRSNKMLLIRVRVEDLEKLAKLVAVTKIEPA